MMPEGSKLLSEIQKDWWVCWWTSVYKYIEIETGSIKIARKHG